VKNSFLYNNFDLIRLLAAVQVLLGHGISHLGLESFEFLKFLPGVPIFFFVSGFLISLSYEKRGGGKGYAFNRFLRLYPALIVCLFFSVISVFFAGYKGLIGVTLFEFTSWVLAQVSFLQFYNPDFLRGYGAGVLNGSLWTISVEIQFYVLVPVLYLFLSIFSSKYRGFALLVLIFVFAVLNKIFMSLYSEYSEFILYKITKVSFIPWFYMFLIGVLFQMYWQDLLSFLEGKRILVFSVCLTSLYGLDTLGYEFSKGVGFCHFLLLSVLIFASAFSVKGASSFTLRGMDLSYGVYIYHMPVINFIVFTGWVSGGVSLIVAILLSFLFAAFSWFLVEKPVLSLKWRSLRLPT